MAASTAAKTKTTNEAAGRSAAAAMRNTAATGPEDIVEVDPSADEVESDAMQWLSRMTYSSSYVLAYGVVYAAVFVAQSLPQENPIMHGMRDGGRAAMDQLEDG